MATTKVLLNGTRNYVVQITGTGGDSAVNIFDVATVTPECAEVRIQKCYYDVAGSAGLVTLLWEATANTAALPISTGSGQTLDFHDVGGLVNNAGAGKTGDLLLTSTATTPYTVTLWLKKVRTVS